MTQPTPAPKVESIQTPATEEWSQLKSNQATQNLADTAMNENLKLPVKPDGTLDLFWFDAHEELNHNGEVFIFGKVYLPD